MNEAAIESARGYLALGLVDLAEAEVSRIHVTQEEIREVREIQRQIAFVRGNFTAVRDLTIANIENSSDPAVDMYAISIAGHLKSHTARNYECRQRRKNIQRLPGPSGR